MNGNNLRRIWQRRYQLPNPPFNTVRRDSNTSWRVKAVNAAILGCRFSWNIMEIQKKLASKSITLYSPSFYTAGKNGGYKMCLFLYLDGDGSGKGTHLSFYITVMRGEHDNRLMMWPFQQKITLTLKDQSHQQHDITQCFKPDPAEYNTSFQRPSPHSEMNVAFGFPQFAPLTVLDNPSYVKDDILRLHCIIDTIEA